MYYVKPCEHDECVVIHTVPGSCPLCSALKRIPELESDVKAAERRADNAENDRDCLKEEFAREVKGLRAEKEATAK